jgi:hypothetical protein
VGRTRGAQLQTLLRLHGHHSHWCQLLRRCKASQRLRPSFGALCVPCRLHPPNPCSFDRCRCHCLANFSAGVARWAHGARVVFFAPMSCTNIVNEFDDQLTGTGAVACTDGHVGVCGQLLGWADGSLPCCRMCWAVSATRRRSVIWPTQCGPCHAKLVPPLIHLTRHASKTASLEIISKSCGHPYPECCHLNILSRTEFIVSNIVIYIYKIK